MLRAGLCWTATAPVTPAAPLSGAVKGPPAKTGVGSDGLESGMESLDRPTIFQGSSAWAVKLGLAESSPARVPLFMPTLLVPSSSETTPLEDDTMCGLMCQTGTIFWSH